MSPLISFRDAGLNTSCVRPSQIANVMIKTGDLFIDLDMRTVWRNGEALPLGSRAFEILAVIVRAAGRLVTKDELMSAVWPDTVVEENTIQVHLSAVRKVLGSERDLILTVPGRGYRMLQQRKIASAGKACTPCANGKSLPPQTSPLLGRDAEIALIGTMLHETRVLTIVGAGGIGKTRLAIEAARQTSAGVAEPVCFVELAALTSHESVRSAINEGLGPRSSPAAGPKLLLLDNAEHVIDAVASVVDALVSADENIRVLITSREPLRVMAEMVLRITPLDVPLPDATEPEILRCSAVDLFFMRANGLHETLAESSAEIHLAGEICRRLDGMPLAIELAAARVAALGLEGVCRRLDDRMSILAGGYRTALPRHQTLRATFDWSFALLDTATRSVFRRLALFSGKFSFDVMCAAVCDDALSLEDAIDGIAELVAKSLVNVEFEGATVKYRLCESTRAYAMEKLRDEGELREIIVRNARYLSHSLSMRRCSEMVETKTRFDFLARLRPTLDDARAAFDWAFSIDGDAQAGIELASILAGALLDADLPEECCARASQAVEAMKKLPAGALDHASEKRILHTLTQLSRPTPDTVTHMPSRLEAATARVR